MARQRTRWEYSYYDKKGPFARMGRVFNPKGYPGDIIRLQVWDGDRDKVADFSMTVDEALVIATGLMRVTTREVWVRGLGPAMRRHYEA